MIWVSIALYSTVFAFIYLIGFVITSHIKRFKELKDKNRTIENLLSKRNSELISVRTKHGQAWEKWIPQSKQFEEQVGDKQDARFIGMPIDFIHFSDEWVTIVEIKTGKSKLSSKQNRIKKLVDAGKIRWVELSDELEES